LFKYAVLVLTGHEATMAVVATPRECTEYAEAVVVVKASQYHFQVFGNAWVAFVCWCAAALAVTFRFPYEIMEAEECQSSGLSVGKLFVGESDRRSFRSIQAEGVNEFPFQDPSVPKEATVDQLEKSRRYPQVP